MLVIVDPEAVLREQLAAMCGEGDPRALVGTLPEAEAALEQGAPSPRLVVLGPGVDRAAALRFAEKADEHFGPVATLLVTDDLDPVLLREALRSGMGDVLTIDAARQEWDEALARARARVASERDVAPTPATDDNRAGRLVTVFSTKGGCGKSLIAANLAVLAAEHIGERVPLIDLDLQSGDLAIMFQLLPSLSIFDAAVSAARLDVEALNGHFTHHRSGVSLLAAPAEPSMGEQVTADAVTRILELLKASHPLTLVDGPAQFTDQLLAALDLSDLVVLVGSMDVPSIKNLRVAMNTLAQLGFPRERTELVLNRADSKVGLRPADVEKSLGASIDVMIPSSRDAPLSVNQGTPLAVSRPRSPIVNAVRGLLPAVAPTMTEPVGRSRRRRRAT